MECCLMRWRASIGECWLPKPFPGGWQTLFGAFNGLNQETACNTGIRVIETQTHWPSPYYTCSSLRRAKLKRLAWSLFRSSDQLVVSNQSPALHLQKLCILDYGYRCFTVISLWYFPQQTAEAWWPRELSSISSGWRKPRILNSKAQSFASTTQQLRKDQDRVS